MDPSPHPTARLSSDLLAAPPKASPRLLFSKNGRPVFELPLARPRLRIGRGPSCDLRLPDGAISRIHLVVERRGQTVTLRDRSRNGTEVNGLLLHQGSHTLRAGDHLRLGTWTARFVPLEMGEIVQPADDDTVRGWDLDASGKACLEAGTQSGATTPSGASLGPSELGLVGSSPCIQALRSRILEVAPYPVSVLVTGETGTGKERVAQALHKAAFGRNRSFCAVNCGAIHSQTAASTLFGHERGAFTGANSRHTGLFAQAQGGTVFLDEVGELSAELQAALLRVLETREVRPLGGSKTVSVDFRLVTATHRDLLADIAEGRFREDLFYRIGVVHLRLEPLRRRPEDLLPLGEHLLSRVCGGSPPSLGTSAVARLATHPWPGNVRELRNVLLRSLIGHNGPVLEARDIAIPSPNPPRSPALNDRAHAFSTRSLREPWLEDSSVVPPARPPADALRGAILNALHLHNGNRKAAAASLGIARSTLYARMQRLGMRAPPHHANHPTSTQDTEAAPSNL